MGNIQLQIDLTNIVLAVVAIVGLIAAWNQLKLTQLATRASVLLKLDERFGTEAMLAARNEMAALIIRINKEADERWSALELKARRAKSSELYPVALDAMRTAASAEAYGRLMVALSFFETVGYVTYSEYIPLHDVLKLFGPTIKDAGIAFEAHIRKLRETYRSNDLYNNFLWLIEKSKPIE